MANPETWVIGRSTAVAWSEGFEEPYPREAGEFEEEESNDGKQAKEMKRYR